MTRKALVKLINYSMAQWIKTGEKKYQTAYQYLLQDLKTAINI